MLKKNRNAKILKFLTNFEFLKNSLFLLFKKLENLRVRKIKNLSSKCYIKNEKCLKNVHQGGVSVKFSFLGLFWKFEEVLLSVSCFIVNFVDFWRSKKGGGGRERRRDLFFFLGGLEGGHMTPLEEV